MFRLKRVYDPASNDDGVRLLVEHLWPCAVKKTHLQLVAWLKDVAPSTELRRWFSHNPAKWTEFHQRYFAELDARPETVELILKASSQGLVTLLFSSHDAAHNNAVARETYIAAHRGRHDRR
jgi:uncharacterized protein YeaO (DUF488 family)